MKTLSPRAQELWDKYGDALGEFEVASQIRGKVAEPARNQAARKYLATIRELHNYIVGLEEFAAAPGRVVVNISIDGTGVTLVQNGDEVDEAGLDFAKEMFEKLMERITAPAPDATGTPS